MTNDPSIGSNIGPIRGASTDGVAKKASSGEGAAFKVLLDKLEVQARRLQDSSTRIDKPEELAGAVDRARVSIDDALSLSDQILEAYRAAKQRGETGQSEEETK